ncbi:collagen-binding domain-containing protein [Phenylobacterium kunshanense]|uniref:PEP-CTERM sorting domain-containing protein n=1 Tax=Phenylobacterium kunshanense TaxID=1445034 RepID=A0A328BCJ9_9CAUL|nr:collagen-binding domain-containing protein [Phenylobacterium kunshanense]RAK64395.1 PEP-CTERM sorting domain-containing protein [Phenylobacterium kunshanense]
MNLRKTAASLAVCMGALTAGAAHAGVTEMNAALDAMGRYNLIVQGNVTSSSEVEGRAFVGGSVLGNASNYNLDNLSGAGLTVVGNVDGGKKNVRGDILVGGNVVSGVEFQSPAPHTLTYGGTLANTNINGNVVIQDPGLGASLAAERDAMFAGLNELSLYLASLDETHTATPVSGNLTFNPGAGSGVAVYSIADLPAALGATSNLQFAFPTSYDAVVVNVAGSNIALPGGFNFNGPSGLGTKVIWNFYEATSLNFGSKSWYGSVLAPKASASIGNFIEGTAVFASLNQNGEIHTPGFGDWRFQAVPEPATWAMMILGFASIGAALRRRPAAVAA